MSQILAAGPPSSPHIVTLSHTSPSAALIKSVGVPMISADSFRAAAEARRRRASSPESKTRDDDKALKALVVRRPTGGLESHPTTGLWSSSPTFKQSDSLAESMRYSYYGWLETLLAGLVTAITLVALLARSLLATTDGMGRVIRSWLKA